MRVDAPRRMPWRMRVGVTTLLGALALFALANIQRARHPAEPTVDFVVWDTEQTSWEGSNARRWSGLIPGTQKRETREVLQLSALRATLVPPHDRTGWALRHGEAFSLLVRPTVNPVRHGHDPSMPPRCNHRPPGCDPPFSGCDCTPPGCDP